MIRSSSKVVRLLSSHNLCKSIYDVGGGVFHRVIPRGGDRHSHAVNLNNRLLPIRCLTNNIHQTDPNCSQTSNWDDSKWYGLFQFWCKKYGKTYSSEKDKLHKFKLFKKSAQVHLLKDNDPTDNGLLLFLDSYSADDSMSPYAILPKFHYASKIKEPAVVDYALEWYQLFKFWCTKYGKTYYSEEDTLHRFKLFIKCAVKCGQRYIINFHTEHPSNSLMCFLDSHSADDPTNECSPVHSLSTLLLSRDNHETNPHFFEIKEPRDSGVELFVLFKFWSKNYGEVDFLSGYYELPGGMKLLAQSYMSSDEHTTNNPWNQYFSDHPLSESPLSRDDDETNPISFKMMEATNVILDLNFFEVFEHWNMEYHKTYSSNHCKLDHFLYLFKLWLKELLKLWHKEYLKACSLKED